MLAVKRALVVLSLLVAALRPASARDVLVRIESLHPPHSLRLQTGADGRIRCDDVVLPWQPSQAVRLSAQARGLRLEGAGAARSCTAVTVSSPQMVVDGRRYAGAITFRCPFGTSTLFAVLRIALEDYVAGVVAAETSAEWPLEALKAQAVCARSYAVAQITARSPHAEEGYDFCDLTHCQSFRGLAPRGSLALEAARATDGLLLSQNGHTLPAYYSSTCGGHTAAAEELFGAPNPALRGVVDGEPAYCAHSPHFRWSVSIALPQLEKALELRELHDIRVVGRGASGRALRLEVTGDRRRFWSAYEFFLTVGQALGWGLVESTWFEVQRRGSTFVFRGRGLGHGLGMCQWGAMEMARRGRNMPQILAHYYPGTRLEKLQ